MTVTLETSMGLLRGWKTVSITRSIKALTGRFSLTVSRRDWDIPFDVDCVLREGDDVVFSGRVGKPVFVDSGDDRTGVTVSGRGRCADIVDSSAIRRDLTLWKEWVNQPLLKIAADLVSPFGIEVVATDVPPEPFPRFNVKPGEKVGAALHRLCRQRAVLAAENALGQLEIFRVPTGAGGPVLGEGGIPYKEMTSDRDLSRRHSDYVVLGQQGSIELTGMNPNASAAAHVRGHAKDSGITRFRPLVLTPSAPMSVADAQDLATYEATVRFGQSLTAPVTVQGWRRPDGRLWAPRQPVIAKSGAVRLKRVPLVVEATTQTFNDDGHQTRLTLTRPEAFQKRAEKDVSTGVSALVELQDGV